MLPLHPSSPLVGHPAGVPDVHPDDPLDSALQRMAEAGVSEIPVVSRAGGTLIGVLRSQDALSAYQKLAGSKEQAKAATVGCTELAPGSGGYYRGGGPHRVRSRLLATHSPLRYGR